MEFAGYEFELSYYNGTLFSLYKDAYVFMSKYQITKENYSIHNQKILKVIAHNSQEQWNKIILLSLINIGLIFHMGIKHHYPKISYCWWVYDFNCIFEKLVKCKDLQTGQLKNLKFSTIFANQINWVYTSYTQYNPELVHVPQIPVRKPITIEVRDPVMIINNIDQRYWQEPQIGVNTLQQTINDIDWKLSKQLRKRNMDIFKLKYINELNDVDIAKKFNLSDTRIRTLNYSTLRVIRRNVFLIDLFASPYPIYNDEHNLSSVNYTKKLK